MTIEPVSSNSGTPPIGSQLSNFRQVRADLQSLSTALQAGDLAGAQQAFATLQQDQPQIASAQTGSKSPVSGALADLGSALKSGDLTGAQQAFAALRQAAQGAHHGHHHHRAAAPAPATAGAASAPGSDPDGDSNRGTGSVLNVTA